MSEILRDLADLIDNAESGQVPASTVPPQQAAHGQPFTSKFTPVTQEPEGNAVQGVFVPPLQAKLELLKKSVDVNSIYDDSGAGDELIQMKKMAGINTAATYEAGEDNDITG